MNELSPRWKFFRVCCIIQMVLVALQLMLSVSSIFWRKQLVYPITETLAYGVIFVFVYMGLSILNYNYPDNPLTPRQKRNFNWLFLINFLLIAYVFAQLLVEFKGVFPMIFEIEAPLRTYLLLGALVLINLLIFVLHLVFLGGMYKLRRIIYENTVTQWVNQFDEEKK